MAGQPGFFDLNERYTALSTAGDPLEKLCDVVNFEVFRYRRFVAQGRDAESIWTDLNRQVFLGDDRFVARMQALLRDRALDASIPKAQQRPPAPPLEQIASQHSDRDAAIAAAHATGAYSYQQIAEVFGLHFTTVGRVVRAARKTGVLKS